MNLKAVALAGVILTGSVAFGAMLSHVRTQERHRQALVQMVKKPKNPVLKNRQSLSNAQLQSLYKEHILFVLYHEHTFFLAISRQLALPSPAIVRVWPSSRFAIVATIHNPNLFTQKTGISLDSNNHSLLHQITIRQ